MLDLGLKLTAHFVLLCGPQLIPGDDHYIVASAVGNKQNAMTTRNMVQCNTTIMPHVCPSARTMQRLLQCCTGKANITDGKSTERFQQHS